jgi:hypothetical protein
MPSQLPDLDIDLAGLSAEAWCARLDDLGDEHGHFERIGPDHASLFLDAGRKLLVTFEDHEQTRRSPGGRPAGFRMVKAHGWSLLAFFSCGTTWFRDPRIWGTFDRLTDDGFFEDFDRVLFTGAGAAGYAAATYSVAAPGAHVLAIRPQASLDPGVTGWDRRFVAERRRDFTTRYGFAPQMIEAAMAAWVIHDPQQPLDAMHAALFTKPNVTMLRCPGAGRRVEHTLDVLGMTDGLIAAAMEGTLDRLAFARAWRARRGSPAYLRHLSKRLENDGRAGLLAHLCNYGLTTTDRAFFETRLTALARLHSLPGAAE